LKVERRRIDCVKQTVTYTSSREVSYDLLLEEDEQFASEGESLEDTSINAVMTEKMLSCL